MEKRTAFPAHVAQASPLRRRGEDTVTHPSLLHPRGHLYARVSCWIFAAAIVWCILGAFGCDAVARDHVVADVESAEAVSNFFQVLGRSLTDSAFWVGFILVILFANNRFSISGDDHDEVDPPIVARSFTTKFRYMLSAAAYIGCYQLGYITLTGIGSLPFLQQLLTEWIGSLEVPGREDLAIGTPMWAALVTTALLPSLPKFDRFDQRLRERLHRFASIPTKARRLAEEILEWSLKEGSVIPAGGHPSDVEVGARQLDWLRDAATTLRRQRARGYQYRAFFDRYHEAFDRTVDRARRLKKVYSQPQVAAAQVVSGDLDETTQRLARFVACALLQVERSEKAVRETVRTELSLPGFPVPRVGFSLTQITVGIVIVLVSTFLVSLSVLKIVLMAQSASQGVTPAMIGFMAPWTVYMLAMFLPPFILAAGVELYLLDQGRIGNRDWQDKFLAMAALFFGAFCLGVLPPWIGLALSGQEIDAGWLMRILPFGLGPAALSVAFFVRVNCGFAGAHDAAGRRAIRVGFVDFLSFAMVTGLAVLLATRIAILYGLDIAGESGDPSFDNAVALWVLPSTAALLAGMLGTLQCNMSRQSVPERAQKEPPEHHNLRAA